MALRMSLRRQRRLTVGHIQQLSAKFGLPADVFMD
jgi:antitoxin component HigA of HigAB toxin-antitoxin module